ncbi:hypothetical protein SAY86_015612 [Trapa natans]|uniref:TLC domain-containing protein n=1 Tax=Trapa natans TaxID=22666 RepID=A0AAN7LIA2_TRANT|nr:hypothetical protein SAY86_015612 [Trapa natans]
MEASSSSRAASVVFSSMPPLTLFFSFFILVYLTAYFVFFRRWSAASRPEASSCAISLLHGTPAVVLSVSALLFDPSMSPSFASPNSAAQSTAIDFSIAYFVTDILHYLAFSPADVLFILHHVATLFVLLTCRFNARHGARAVLSLLALAEITSACQNVWTLARLKRAESARARKVLDVLCRPFYTFYSVVRGVVGPLFVIEMGRFYISGEADGHIPMWVWLSWILVVVTAIFVSVLWIANLWTEFYREKKGKLGDKSE